jgi:hypothetical protein
VSESASGEQRCDVTAGPLEGALLQF